jgi:hypothetical protein
MKAVWSMATMKSRPSDGISRRIRRFTMSFSFSATSAAPADQGLTMMR